MDSESEQYNSIQLLSESDVIDLFYHMLRTAMDNAAFEAKNKSGFDGNILEEDAKNLAEFCSNNQVSPLSQALAEVLTCMERKNEKKQPDIRDTAVYNALLRLEKSVIAVSTWELYGTDFDGPILDLTNLEANLIEQQISIYVVDTLNENSSEALFFPLENFYSSGVIVKWRILEKIATIKLFAQETIYKRKLKIHLVKRLKREVTSWLQKEFEKFKLLNIHTVRKDIECLTKILKDLQSQVNMAMDVTLSESLFSEADCSYSDVLSETIDDILFPVCERVMELMDAYQIRHKEFHVNMRDSCALVHSFYLQLKKLVNLLITQDKMERKLKLQDYIKVFVKFFMNLLQVIKSECHNRIKRAVQAEMKDNVHDLEKILSSSVIVLNCLCTVIDEWKHLEIEDEEQRIAFLVKITDIVCDGAKIYAESLECRLQGTNVSLKDQDALRKACILANSVHHVFQYLQELPHQMQWSAVLDDINDESTENGLKQQVLRILCLIHESMNTHTSEIVSRILNTVVNSICSNLERMLLSWLQSQSTNQAFDKFLGHLNDILESLDETLKEELFPEVISILWSALIQSIEKGFQEGQCPEYARTVKDNVLSLKEYLIHVNMKEVDRHKQHLQRLIDVLDLNSKTTEELQLGYYVQIAESVVSPVEYLGHIAFQAGYKTTCSEFVDLYINVQKGQRLPARKCEMSQLVVKVELCPNTLFPTFLPLKSQAVTEDLDNPVFNSSFQLIF